MLQTRFFDYKTSVGDDISLHIQKINDMTLVLADFGNLILHVIILLKIICSLLLSYNEYCGKSPNHFF